MHTIATQLNALRDELNATFLEREDFTQALLLALLSSNNVSGVGAPGTGKSKQVRALVGALTGAKGFEAALSKNRPAEAVFGPVDIKALRETGDYKLRRSGFITDAHIAFLDEGFKMSPTMGHDLLPVLNERIYHEVNGGRSVHKTPLRMAVIASNEFPTDEDDNASALWDRIMLRVVVDYIQDDDNFVEMLRSDNPDPNTTIAWEDVVDAIDNLVPAIAVSDEILKALAGLRGALRREGINPSDRRFNQSVRILQASAFLGGRESVALSDIEALKMVLWDTPQQIEKVERVVMAAAHPYYEPVQKLRDMVTELTAGIDQRADESTESKSSYAQELFKKLRTARENLLTLQMEAGADDLPGGDKLMKEIDAVGKRGMVELLEQSPEQAQESLTALWAIQR